jgi:hypothetical protein
MVSSQVGIDSTYVRESSQSADGHVHVDERGSVLKAAAQSTGLRSQATGHLGA